MNNIKKAVFYIIFKSKSTIFNMLGVRMNWVRLWIRC